MTLSCGCVHWHQPPPDAIINQAVAARLRTYPQPPIDLSKVVAEPEVLKLPDYEDDAWASDRPPSNEPNCMTLGQAIDFALRNSPRLETARAAIERAGGMEAVAFAPFLPDLQLNARTGATSANLSPGAPSITGGILGAGDAHRRFDQVELQLQWTLCDFGRTAGRWQQTVFRERITQQQLGRLSQTIILEVQTAYLQVLLTSALRIAREEAIRAAEATLKDATVRRAAGNADKDDVLRAEVRVAETREDLVIAREEEFTALARLNHAMGRNASLPLRVVEFKEQPLFLLELPQCLEEAASRRLEIGIIRDGLAVAQQGRRAVEGEFLPKVYMLGTIGYVSGDHIQTGWQEGAGLHLAQGLFSGGRCVGDLRIADADIRQAVSTAETVLDGISLEVTLAFCGVTSARERIGLSRPAIDQARETLRLVRVKYRNGDATPTDVVDAESALTRSQQRYAVALFEFLSSLSRMEFALGSTAGTCLRPEGN
jgi:outer membrane protein TolC